MKSSAIFAAAILLASLLLAALWSTSHPARAADSPPATPSTPPTTQPRSSDNDIIRKELLKEKERALTDIAGLQARLEQAQEQFTALNTELEKQINDDPSLVASRQALVQRLDRLKYLQTSPSFTPDDIGNTYQNIADIQFRITERTDRIHTFSHDFAFNEIAIIRIHAAIDLHDTQARLDSINTRLTQLH